MAKNDWIGTDGHRVHQASGPDDNNRVIRPPSDDIGRDKLEAAVAVPTVAENDLFVQFVSPLAGPDPAFTPPHCGNPLPSK